MKLFLKYVFLLALIPGCGSEPKQPPDPPERTRRVTPGESPVHALVERAGHGTAGKSEERRAESPTPLSAARRALVLRALTQAALFPRAGDPVSPEVLEHFEAERNGLLDWLRSEGALEEVSPREKKVLEARAGTLPRGETVWVASQNEPLAVILWALELRPSIPPYDQRAPDGEALGRSLPAPTHPAGELLEKARLRPVEEIETAWRTAKLWRWRALTRTVMKERLYPQGADLDREEHALVQKAHEEGFALEPIRDGESFFREMIRFYAHHSYKRGEIPVPIEGDFPALRKPYLNLTEREAQRLKTIADERVRALSWLLGRSKSWDEIPEDD